MKTSLLNRINPFTVAAATLAASLSWGAAAAPITFTSTSYDTHASAFAGPASDGPDDQSGDPVLLSSAFVATATDSAAADAIADHLFLAASTEAISTLEASGAEAIAGFSGSFFTPGGAFSLWLDFEDFSDALGDGSAGAELFVTLVVDGLTLFDESYTVSQLMGADFATAAGLAGLLDITLVSLSDAFGDGSGFNLASADFSLNTVSLNTVPVPASLALLLAGLGGLTVVQRRAIRSIRQAG